MLAAVTLPTIPCELRSENVHQEAVGPGFESPHLHQQAQRHDTVPLSLSLVFAARDVERLKLGCGDVSIATPQ